MAYFQPSEDGGVCMGCGRKFSVWNIAGMYAAKLSRAGRRYQNIMQANGQRHAKACQSKHPRED